MRVYEYIYASTGIIGQTLPLLQGIEINAMTYLGAM